METCYAISKCIYSLLKFVPNKRINKELILTFCKIILKIITNEKYHLLLLYKIKYY